MVHELLVPVELYGAVRDEGNGEAQEEEQKEDVALGEGEAWLVQLVTVHVHVHVCGKVVAMVDSTVWLPYNKVNK